MKARMMVAAFALALAGCESLPIPTSLTNPPSPNAREDQTCMQDCLGSNGDEEFCHARCAK